MGEDRNDRLLKIGDLAKRYELNVRTLRYYETIGLLPEPARTESGYRLYSEEDARRLEFVLQAKRVGFSLEEIQRIVQLGRHGAACGYVRETLTRHLAQIDRQIADLQRLRAELSAAATAWQEPGAVASGQVCGLIERWSSSPRTTHEEKSMETKRRVEVFTAGCPVCDDTVKLVQSLACPNCEVTVYDLREGYATDECRTLVEQYDIQQLPAVVIDGKLAGCCSGCGVRAEALRAAGLGAA